MRTTRRAEPGFSCFGTVCCLTLAIILMLCSAVPAAAESVQGNNIDDMTGETRMILAQAAVAKLTAQDEDLGKLALRQNNLIRGRGRSDDPSGEAPDYVGLVGYAVMYENKDRGMWQENMNLPWQLPAYLRFDNRWFISRSLLHKTPVVVVAQKLKESAPGQYTGRLKIIRLDTSEIAWMDVENFITSPYWFYPIHRAVRYGTCVAVYRQTSGHRPVTTEGKGMSMKNETRVLIPAMDSWEENWDQIVPEYKQLIPGIVFAKTQKEANTPVILFFREEDLSLIY